MFAFSTLWLNMIDNLIRNNSSVLFILESPYIDEVQNGYPLAGESGIEISKSLLNNDQIPLGRICKDSSFSEFNVRPFSIMNVSKNPLEKNAYPQSIIPDNIHSLVTLKKNIDRQHQENGNFHEHWAIPRNLTVRNLKTTLLNELIINLTAIISSNPDIHVIPCGKFARVFLRRALLDCQTLSSSIVHYDFPHPARNQWISVPQNKISELRELMIGDAQT